MLLLLLDFEALAGLMWSEPHLERQQNVSNETAEMALTARQEAILRTLRSKGSVQVEELAQEWKITTQTVRRDLSELCNASLAVRIHGGAKRMTSTAIVADEERRTNNLAAKQAIADRAAELIPNSASVSLNIGSTTEMVAEALRLHSDLTVLSNNINIIPILRGSPLRSLILIGGEIRLEDGAVVGIDALATIAKYKVDFAVIGASSIDPDGSVLDFDEREVTVARTILANARRRILVADNSKFSVGAPHRIGDIGELDYLVTDLKPPQSFLDHMARHGTELILSTNTEKLPH